MTIGQAREAARCWIVEQASFLPGFCAAYTAGSTNWLPDGATLSPASDVDVMLVLADPPPYARSKFVYNDALLEVTYLSSDMFHFSERILGDYHLAPSFRTAKILVSPLPQIISLHSEVCKLYAETRWVRERCRNARDNSLRHLRSIRAGVPLSDQVIAYLFGAGVTTHILLTAGLRNPTIKNRYAAVRGLLIESGLAPFHETLLAMLGSAHMSRERVCEHVSNLTELSKLAGVPNADVSAAIHHALELIERGYHREAMFWIAVTFSRCQKLTDRRTADYDKLLADLGLATPESIERRRVAVEEMLPMVCGVAEAILAGGDVTSLATASSSPSPPPSD